MRADLKNKVKKHRSMKDLKNKAPPLENSAQTADPHRKKRINKQFKNQNHENRRNK
ncbi:MAG: hypothetical protein JWR23_1585 [Mucilaginibacter sp.]|nr:hypothetical protein [Mucilaginibacter sp.]